MLFVKDYKAIVDHLFDGLYIVDPNRMIVYWNQSAERISGYREDEVLGSHCFDNLLNHCTECGNVLCENKCPLHATLKDGKLREAYVYLKHKQGHRVPVHVKIAPIRNEYGVIEGAVEIFTNNTRVHSLTEELVSMKQAAFLDSLTQMPNRRCLDDQVSRQVERLEKNEIKSCGLLFIDIDKFKQVNDTHGHEAGDAVLVSLSSTLKSCARASDIVGRWGGDEFVGIYPSVNRDTLQNIGTRIRYLVANSSANWNEIPLSMTVSVGGSMLEPGQTFQQWIQQADKALYQCKDSGRNTVTIL